MKRNTQAILFLVILLGLFALAVISYELMMKSRSNWLSKEMVCVFPCWQQITPQETSFAEALSKLQEKNMVGIADEDGFDFEVNNVSGSVNKSPDGMVGFIVLQVKYQSARLGEIVQLIGAPEKMRMGHEVYSFDTCYVFLVFPDNGVIAELYLHNDSKDQSECQARVSPKSQIFRIVLLGYDLYNNNYWKRSFEHSEFIEWNGYGTYSK